MRVILAFVIFCVGAVLALHFSMNAAVGKTVANPRMGNALFWIIGACTAVVIGLTGWDAAFWGAVREVPVWLWGAGVLGAAMVFAIVAIIPQLGAGTTNIVLLSGQVLGGMLIAHYGFLGSPVERINAARVTGALLAVAGSALVVLGRFPWRQ
ncbi:MAG TPA: hypothetical protein HPP77_08425 [Candidatus Hydrogenedentes bacterium]|nr:hypothetical protein [Candidatus Hydrogenedentota bacterium]